MGRYRKIDTRIWNDEKFRCLSDDGKLGFLLLLSHPHMTSIGAMRATVPGLAAELRWPEEKLASAFGEVIGKGMAKHDPAAAVFWLPNFIRFNPPENPNVLKAWAGAVELLPECALTREAIAAVAVLAEGLTEAFQEALAEPFRKGMAKPEPKPKQEQQPEPNKNARARAPLAGVRGIDEDEQFDHAMLTYPAREGSNPRGEAFKAWTAELRAGASPEEISAGVARYARFVQAKGSVGTQYVMQAARFFAEKHYREPWTLQPPKERDTWWTNDDRTVRKGRELGIEARPGETMASFRDRIRASLQNAASLV
jgi:hypothetical protein